MKPRLDVITLAVSDLEKSLAFYRDGLGLQTKGIVAREFKGTETDPAGAVAFFELQGGLLLALYPRKELAKDSKLHNTAASSLEFSLGYMVESKKAVDEFLQKKPKQRELRYPIGRTTALGHIFRILQRSGRTLVGDHLESTKAVR